MGLGVGFGAPTFLVSVQASVEWEERGGATGSIMFMRILSQSWGATLFGAVVNFELHRRLGTAPDAVNWLLTSAHRESLGADRLAAVQAAAAASMHDVYLVVLTVAVIALALSQLYPVDLRPVEK